MTGTSQKLRCAGCGKVIAQESEGVRIVTGVFGASGLFEDKSLWGHMHRNCFGRAIDDPNDAMARIRKIAGK